MTDKIKFYLEDRLKRLEDIRNEREWTTAELGDATCCKQTLAFINSLQEEPDPYIQYASREAGIKAHAEDYSFNIESELFQQLTTDQQNLWRKEIEQAVISGGYCGLNLAKDPRYKENLEVKEVDLEHLEQEVKDFCYEYDDRKEKWYELCQNDRKLLNNPTWANFAMSIAKHFFELGLQVAQKGE